MQKCIAVQYGPDDQNAGSFQSVSSLDALQVGVLAQEHVRGVSLPDGHDPNSFLVENGE
jgi:hypothetical protein